MPVTRTFLFTDIEGSTRSEQREPVAWASNHEIHNKIIEEIVRANNGEVYKNTGDGYQAAFVNAPEALKAALEIQREVGETDWKGDSPVRVRMGLHTGEAELKGHDYLGDDLHRAARLMDAGHGGQVLLSLVTSELVRDALRRDPSLAGVELRELGVYGLRDLERPERIFQLVAQGLQSSFPALRSETSFFTNLPTEIGDLVGRREEMKALCDALSRTRLLTITGMGGVGKTRIAIHLAREVATDYKDGVARIELGSLSDPDLVVQTVASVFNVGESGSTPLKESLIFYLQRKVVLLFFDNCEHLLDACADLIGNLLNRTSELKVVATSRERLDIEGETVYSLPMLGVPKESEKLAVDDLQSYPAMELFVSEAKKADSSFQVTERNVGKIAEVCKHLDGNALAIKLAASLTPTLSVEEILDRLRERFEVLVQSQRQRDPRHRTLKAAIDWSYELLNPDEATVFRRLAVFAGGWSLKAAESVCVDERVAQNKLVTIMNNLLRKNLIMKVASEPESRFTMLETVHEYANMRLGESDEVEELKLKHATYYVDLAKREGAKLWGAEPQAGLSKLEQDYDDLVCALDWGRKSEAGQDAGLGLQLAAELGLFWERRGYLTEGRERLAQALRSKRRPEYDMYRADALDAAARLAFLQNDYRDTMDLYEKSLKIRQQLASVANDTRLKHGVVGVLNKMGLAALRNGDLEVAEKRLIEAMELAKETKHTRGIVRALDHLAELAWRKGDYAKANERYEECLKYARQQQSKNRDIFMMDALSGQGRLLMMQGKYDEAAEAFKASLEIRKSQSNKTSLAYSISDLSEVAFRKGDYETARKYAEESLAMRQEARTEWGIAKSLHQLAQAKHKLGLEEEALQHARESLTIFEGLQYRKGIAESLSRIAEIRFDMGEKEVAARLFGAAEAALDGLKQQLASDQRDYYDHSMLTGARRKLDKKAWSEGREMGMDAAIALAQEDAS